MSNPLWGPPTWECPGCGWPHNEYDDCDRCGRWCGEPEPDEEAAPTVCPRCGDPLEPADVPHGYHAPCAEAESAQWGAGAQAMSQRERFALGAAAWVLGLLALALAGVPVVGR